MEIRHYLNTKTAFGMAFRTPKGKDLEIFEGILFNRYQRSDKDALRGLKQFARNQAKNTRYDIQFKDGKFHVLDNANSDIILESYDPVKTYCPTMLEHKTQYYGGQLCKHRDNDVRHAITSLAGILSMIKESIVAKMFKPSEYLPAGMRKAAERANALENLVGMRSNEL